MPTVYVPEKKAKILSGFILSDNDLCAEIFFNNHTFAFSPVLPKQFYSAFVLFSVLRSVSFLSFLEQNLTCLFKD